MENQCLKKSVGMRAVIIVYTVLFRNYFKGTDKRGQC